MRAPLALGLSALLTIAVLASSAPAPQGVGEMKVNGYLVKVKPGVSVAQLEAISERVLGPGWQVVHGYAPDHYRVQPRAGFAVRSPHAAAWNVVHELNASAATVWAEPAFADALQLSEQDSDPPVGECTPAWQDFGAAPKDPGAMKDSEWSLKDHPGVNAHAAWKRFAGLDKAGADIIVGHPDTGFLDHAAIRTARLGDGFDFTSGRSSAIDVAQKGNLQWPGHGTRTSSVIAGRPFVVEGGVRHISGVAPAARFMPLKVAHRVVLLPYLEFDMENLAMAIHAAAIGDPNFVERPAHVISMSLGGRNSRAVEEALAVAEENDVIVLAAAGNKVPRHIVVFPARYPNVLAIAASNSSSEPWPDTSRGVSVAVSAPGQNVWSAKRREADGKTYDCAEMSSGTSYAVATTAGVAALWLSYHSQRGGVYLGSVPRIFRQLVQATAWAPDNWDSDRLGPGIVDADKLLAASLPTGQPARIRTGICADMVALATIVPPDAAAALLTGTRDVDHACRAIKQTGDELASLYVGDERAANAFERFRESAGAPRAFAILRDAILALEPSDLLAHQLRTAGSVEKLTHARPST